MSEMKIDDGGSAFPHRVKSAIHRDGVESSFMVEEGEPGISVRDYMAAKAMQGELAATNEGLPMGVDKGNLEVLAGHWYRIADAMLKARKS